MRAIARQPEGRGRFQRGVQRHASACSSFRSTSSTNAAGSCCKHCSICSICSSMWKSSPTVQALAQLRLKDGAENPSFYLVDSWCEIHAIRSNRLQPALTQYLEARPESTCLSKGRSREAEEVNVTKYARPLASNNRDRMDLLVWS